MGEPNRAPTGGPSGPPEWLPAAVGSAARTGGAGEDELFSGRALEDLLGSLRRVGGVLASDRAPAEPVDRAAGYRHLLVLLSLGIDEALRTSDPYRPVIRPGNVDAVLKWGMDCPDAAYVGAGIRGDATYVVRGSRGTVRYLGFQVMAGIESTANLVADDLEIGPDGRFELVLSADEQPGNWLELSPRASSLVVRQFFYDWATEEPAELTIECTSGGPARAGRRGGTDPTPAGVANQLSALGRFVEASVGFWLDIEEGGRAQGLNRFREPAARTEMGAAAENVSVWGSWELADDQALVIEVTPPEALYWSVSLGNFWWETIDYAGHQSSLNGHQAVIDRDGVFRAVVAGRDPGVANWLDTAGNHRGPIIFRWLRAEDAPVPSTTVVALDEVDRVLPASTVRVDPDERRRVVGRRRAAVERRFAR